MPCQFAVQPNKYLTSKTVGYYHQLYTGYRTDGNPDFLNKLKNTFNTEPSHILQSAKQSVVDILLCDIPFVINETGLLDAMCVCVPRAKTHNAYSDSQLMFCSALKDAVNKLKGVGDGTDCVVRQISTYTTHLKNEIKNYVNDGLRPYPGITRDTCRIDDKRISGRNILLIDDIYTQNINIDEDCIQAIYDAGARNVVFYAIGYTRREQ
jgi:hypothetical protein